MIIFFSLAAIALSWTIWLYSSHEIVRRCDVDPGYATSKALEVAKSLASGTWELGTTAEALLEYHDAAISVFATDPFPRGRIPVVRIDDVEGLQYAIPHIRTSSDTLQHDNRELRSCAGSWVFSLTLTIHRQCERPCVDWSGCTAHWPVQAHIFGRRHAPIRVSAASSASIVERRYQSPAARRRAVG